MLHIVHYKKFPFTELQENYRVQRSITGIPLMNQTHPNQTFHLFLLILSNQYMVALSVQLVGYILENWVQILAEATELSLLQNIPTISSNAQPPTQ
jgi:hypothetical protein